MTNYGIWSQVRTQLVVFVGLTVLLCIQLKSHLPVLAMDIQLTCLHIAPSCIT